MSRRRAGPLLWVGLVATTAGLWGLGHGALAGPPLAHPSRLTAWWMSRGPTAATIAVIRAGLVWAGAYLVVAAPLVCLGGSRLRRLRLPGMRIVVCFTAGASSVLLAAPASATGPLPGPATGPAAAPELQYLGPASGSPSPASPPGRRRVAPADNARRANPSTPVPRSHRNNSPPPARTQPTRSPATSSTATRSAPSGTWVVRPGDDLWSIAQARLTESTAGTPDVGEVAEYWQQVIALNRSRLPDPANPNLIFPGDVVLLPPSPAPRDEPPNW